VTVWNAALKLIRPGAIVLTNPVRGRDAAVNASLTTWQQKNFPPALSQQILRRPLTALLPGSPGWLMIKPGLEENAKSGYIVNNNKLHNLRGPDEISPERN
jgi:hypothetical protein